jgi:streptogramin lyase
LAVIGTVILIGGLCSNFAAQERPQEFIRYRQPGAFTVTRGKTYKATPNVIGKISDREVIEFPSLLTRSNMGKLIASDPDGYIWYVDSGEDKEIRIDPKTLEMTEYQLPRGASPYSITIDKKGGHWITAHGIEVLLETYPEKGIAYAHVPPGHGFLIHVNANFRDDTVWISMPSENKLVSFHRERGFREYTMPTPESGPGHMDFDAQGYVWCPELYANKLARLDTKTGKFEEFPLPTDNALPVFCMVDSKQNVWVSEPMADKYARFKDGKFKEYEMPTKHSIVSSSLEDKDGKIWITEGGWRGSAGGNKIAVLSPETGKIEEMMVPTPNAQPVGLVMDNEGAIWFQQRYAGKLGRISARRNPEHDSTEGDQRVKLSSKILFEFKGENDGDSAGREVAGIGDVDGDGIPDLAVGAPGYGNLRGCVYIYSGATGKILHRLEADKSGIVFGRSIAGIKDIDGDKHADFIVGAPQADLLIGNGSEDMPDAGSVYVYSGATAKLLYRYDGEAAGDYLGKGVSTAGDMDGDGVPDFMFSAPGAKQFTGEVFVYSGATGKLLSKYSAREQGGRYGWAIAGGQDVDGDKVPDIIVGAPWSSQNGHVNSGSVYVYSGASHKLLYQLHGEAAGDGFGNSVAFVGDLDGDGRADFVVGSPLANPRRQQDAGSAFVYSGATGKLLYRFDGENPTDIFGFSVASAGDVDGDGVPDLVIGSQWADPEKVYNAGSAFVYSGRTGKLLSRINGSRKGAECGFAVASAGDVNGNGRSRIIIGAPNDCDAAGSAILVAFAASSPQHAQSVSIAYPFVGTCGTLRSLSHFQRFAAVRGVDLFKPERSMDVVLSWVT